MRILFVIFVYFSISLFSCHPSYKRLTSERRMKDTIWVKYSDLPKPVFDTLEKYYQACFTPDTSDDIKNVISLDVNKQFVDIAYYDAYSNKFRIPFGWYFKLGKEKYFIHYSQLKSPIIYYENYLYYKSGVYFDKTIKNKLYDNSHERWPYDKQFYVKYKLK